MKTAFDREEIAENISAERCGVMTLSEVCQNYYLAVYRRCLHALYYNEALAQDITQDVFHELCMHWDELEKSHICAWLYKTADYMVLRTRTKYARSGRKIVPLHETHVEDLPAKLSVHEQMLIDKINENPDLYCEQVYAGLKEREIQLLDCLRAHMKYAEIAEVMGSTEGAITMAALRLNRKVKVLVQKVIDKI